MRRVFHCAALVLVLTPATGVHAQGNPDISLIGQPLVTWTDDAGSPARKRPVFDVGETELVFDAALNPYARGFVTATFAEDAAGIEEGYFSLLRGLPLGIALKGGKYRVGFGKLNPMHPHQLPFAERFGVLAAYLPGEEAFNETGMDLSYRVPIPGTWSVTASADVLQGDSFRIPREPSGAPNDPLVLDPANGDQQLEPRAAWLARVAAFAPAGERSGIEFGFSSTEGTNNVAAAARTGVVGVDLKAKLWTAPSAYLLLQAEYLRLHRQDARWNELTGTYSRNDIHPDGFYVFADFNWDRRYNVGASAESFEDPSAGAERQSAFGAFAGLALMEETTAFRIDWRRIQPAGAPGAPDPEAIQQLTLRVVFSMGPHKAHQF